jgi:hypothetical protein
MVKKYKLLHIDLDDEKIKNGEPIEIEAESPHGPSSMGLVVKHFRKENGTHYFSFKYPASNPLHRSYIFGSFNLELNTGELIIYPQ